MTQKKASKKQWHLRREENVFKLSNNTLAHFESAVHLPQDLASAKCIYKGREVKCFVQKVPKYLVVSGTSHARFGGEDTFQSELGLYQLSEIVSTASYVKVENRDIFLSFDEINLSWNFVGKTSYFDFREQVKPDFGRQVSPLSLIYRL